MVYHDGTCSGLWLLLVFCFFVLLTLSPENFLKANAFMFDAIRKKSINDKRPKTAIL